MSLTLTNECNLELMARYPDNYFELCICDPPYGIGEDGGDKKRGTKGVKSPIYTKKDWDNKTPEIEYFEELFRVSKNVILFGANHYIQTISASGIDTNSSCWIVWDKDNTGDFADCELAWTSFNTAVRKFKYRWNGMLQEDMKNKEVRIHPTQKPVALYKWLLDKYAKPGDKILDTHLGSMSIAIAAHDYGFDLVGCELDKEYFDKGMQRINNHLAQLTLLLK